MFRDEDSRTELELFIVQLGDDEGGPTYLYDYLDEIEDMPETENAGISDDEDGAKTHIVHDKCVLLPNELAESVSAHKAAPEDVEQELSQAWNFADVDEL